MDSRTGRQISATRPPLSAFQTPGTPVNMLCRLSDPRPTMLAAVNGVLYRYLNGWLAVNSAVTVDTDRPLYASPFLKKAVIANGTSPLVYNADGDTLAAMVATAGTIPADCRVVASWQGSIWLAGNPDNPHVFQGSRTGTETDWQYTDTDAGGAFTVTGENEGLIGEPITALVPHTADTMIVGCRDSLWALRGHPRRGGVLEAASQNIGILGQGAWCKAPGDQLFVLSKLGLVAILSQVGAVPTPISRERIPDKLVGLAFDSLNPVVSMEYDVRWNGIHICVRGAEQQAWWYDMDNGGFWELEFADYPLVMSRFDQLESLTTSGVLYGGSGYGGLAHFNTQGYEELNNAPSQSIGPIRVSPSPMEASLIHEARFVLGAEMFAGGGSATIYGGESGERAAANAATDDGVLKFRATRDTLLANAGITTPRIAAHAAVVKLEADTQLANPFLFEGADLFLKPAGTMRRTRTGAPTAFPSPTSGYAWSQPTSPVSTLTDFSLLVDLARLPPAWWGLPHTDGGDIRVRLSDNTLLPFDLVAFNKTNKTGLLVFKRTITATPSHVRIWAGAPLLAAPAVDDAIGQYNAYDAGTLAFYPLGGGNDRTVNAHHLSMTGAPSVGGVAGPIGNGATAYNGSTQYGQKIGGLAANVPVSFSGWFLRSQAAGTDTPMGVNYTDNGTINSLSNSHRFRVLEGGKVRCETGSSTSTFASASTTNIWTAGSYSHFAARQYAADARLVYLNGNVGAAGFNATSLTMTPDPDSIIVGAISRLTPTSEFFSGSLSLLGVHTVDRVNAWIGYQAAMQDQLSFWGAGWQFVAAAQPA